MGMLIGAGSSSAHLSGSALSGIAVSGDLVAYGREVQRPLDAQCASKGPPPLRQRQAVRVGVQVSAPARHGPAQIGDQPADHSVGRSVDHDTQQV